ncbi:MAG: 1-acyl-sn-glycerol-3-phosphate acyltransferase [Bacteroidota bacterium]
MEPVNHYIQEGILYKPVIPNIQDWPINLFFRNKKRIVKDVTSEAIAQLHSQAQQEGIVIQDYIARTMYLERIRMTEDPWKVDPKDEPKFWGSIKQGLVKNEQLEGDVEAFTKTNEKMLERIVNRYASEISSNFKPSSYHFAKRFLPFMFSTLLNASAGKTFMSIINHRLQLQEKVHLLGEIEAMRNLASKGTIILVPTHTSNMDSILIAWGIHALGLPAFIYGAGLNLYNHKIVSYFLTRLGAYKLDRRKRNPIYRATLDAYSTVAIQEGVHGLFYPGGTRSRSGVLEDRIKLGLLQTAIEAQRRNFMYPPSHKRGKIFIIPLVISYHFVLEAASLIKQHLKRTGQEQYYIINDEFGNTRKFLEFVWNTFSASSEIALSFGRAMDIFGNFVGEDGQSFDSQGREIDIADYFKSGGVITDDKQRDKEYTRLLGEKIVERYRIENIVFSSHLVAFVAFELITRKFPDLDLYSLLRIQEEEKILPLEEFELSMERVVAQLFKLADAGKVKLANHMINDVNTIIEHGVKNLGLYHAKRPLTFKDEHHVVSENITLLYYYHNRLIDYNLGPFV